MINARHAMCVALSMLSILAAPLWGAVSVQDPSTRVNETAQEKHQLSDKEDRPQVLVEMWLIQLAAGDTKIVFEGDVSAVLRPHKADNDFSLQADRLEVDISRRGAQSEDAEAKAAAEPSSDDTQKLELPVDSTRDFTEPVFNAVLVTGAATVRSGRDSLEIRDGRLSITDGGTPVDARSDIKILSAPRMLVNVNQAAEMIVGQSVPYMVRRNDGLFELKQTDSMDEGLQISLKVGAADKERVVLDEIRVRFSTVVGRHPLEGVELDVGRPIIRASEVSSSFSFSPHHSAIVLLPRPNDSAPLLLSVVRARLQD